MGRINGTFNYTLVGEATVDANTGFYNSVDEPRDFIEGVECQIDKSIPAKHTIGEDGQEYSYTYDVFIPKYFKGELRVGARMQIVCEDGLVDEFTIRGVDDCNRKYIEVWG